MSAAQDHDAAYIAEALPAFISEAQEQIASIEQLLLQLENDPADRELLDALFRCAHTVKGSAGIFGLDAVVAFTHHVETLLDRLREGQLALTPALSTLLLRCNDQIRRLVDAASGVGDEPQAAAERAALVDQLAALAAGAAPAAAPAHTIEDKAAQGAAERWRVQVRFGSDTFRNGMDPLAILHYLHELGEVGAIDCDTAAVPPLDALDAESCHGAWTLTLQTTRGQQAVEEAFCFVRDDVQLSITLDEPDAPAAAEPAAATASEVAPTAEATAPGTATPKAREGGADGTRYIRVQADRLDAVINLLGELVIASAGATLMAALLRPVAA